MEVDEAVLVVEGVGNEREELLSGEKVSSCEEFWPTIA